MLLVSVAHANILSWSGGGGADANWGNSANWGFAGTPGNGDTLIFPALVPNLVNTNNLAGLTLNQIRFVGSGGGYDIRGNAFTLTSGILATNTIGGNTIENNITLTGNIQVAVSNSVSLTLACVLSGAGGVNKTGLGTLTYQAPGFPGNNTYTGTTLVSAGTLQFNVNGATAVTGPLVIGDGSGTGSPTVMDLQSYEMENTGPVTINDNGTLNLNNNSEPINFNQNITLSGGTITTGTGSLVLSAGTTLSVSNNYSYIDGNLDTGTGTLTIQGNGPLLYVFAIVSGSANIVQNGAVSVGWLNANTYIGNYSANGSGYVWLNNSLALGNTNNAMTLNGTSWLAISGNSNITNSSLTINSTYSPPPYGTVYVYSASTNSWRASNITFSVTSPIFVETNCALNLIGPIGGPGGLTKLGPGTLTFSGGGNNTYTGTTLVSAGTLQLNVGGVTAFGGPLVIGDGTGTGNPTVMDLIFDEMLNTGPITINTNGLLNLNNWNDTIGTNLTLSSGTIETGTGTLTLSPNCTITVENNSGNGINGNFNIGTSGTLTMQGSGGITFWAVVSGSANIVQDDIAIEWYNDNTFSGNVTVNGIGDADLHTSMALGNPNNSLTLNGSSVVAVSDSVNLTNQTVTFNNINTNTPWYGSLFIYDFFSGTNTWHANFVLAANCIVIAETNCALNLIGPISGPGGVNKQGAGILMYSGSTANTYSGLTTVNQGELDLAKSGVQAIAPFQAGLVIGDGTDPATVVYVGGGQIYSVVTPVVISNNATLNLNGFSDVISPVTMNSGTVNTAGGQLGLAQVYQSGSSTINGTVLPEPLVISNAGQLFMNCNILPYSAYGITKSGQGGVFLTGSNSFTGPTIVQQGSIFLANNWGLGTTASPVVVSNGATLILDAGIYVTNKPLVLNGPGQPPYGALDCDTGVNVWAGPITNNANSTLGAYWPGSELHINGPISGPGGMDLFRLSSPGGTIFYEGSTANTYAGLTTVRSGTLLLNKASGAAVPGDLVVTGVSSVARLGNSIQLADADVLVTNGGLFDFATYADYINTLRGNGTVNFGVSGYLVIGYNNGTSEFDGPMTGTGFSGGYTVGKFGTGTFTLGGNNTFNAGAYHVYSPGRLLVNGSGPTIPAIVDSGAWLGGTGSVGIITANGTVSPGDSPGILTSSNLNFSSSGSFIPLLTGPNPGVGGYSQLIVTGAVSLASAALAVEPAFATPPSIGQQFTIIKNNGGSPVSGTFNSLTNGAQYNTGGYFFRVNYNGGAGNDVVLTLVGVPGKTVTLNAVATGWYYSTGHHDNNNPNYYAGQDALLSDTNLYRDFFVFNAPVSTASIISAELIVNDYYCGSPHGRETYVLYDVTNAISAVEAGGSGLTNIYNDLGSGSVYGIRTVSTNETGERAIIPLNYGFINALTAAAGGQIALGGAITTLTPTNGHNQYLFSGSGGNPTDAQLRVTFGTSIITNAISQGWYTSVSGTHTASNPNYFAGIASLLDTNFYRDFFVFNVPPVPGQPVNAELWVNSFDNASPSGVNTYQLRAVSTPISTLTNNASGATSTYAALASGALYGGRDVYVSESRHFLGIPLNNAFISAATNSGGLIALGGSLSSLTLASTNEYLFGNSLGPASNVQLWLGFLASPLSNPSFTGGTPTYLGNNRYQLTLSGTTGITNEIQSSFDFQNWDYITDVAMPAATNTFYYTNGNFTVPYRFFRVRALP